MGEPLSKTQLSNNLPKHDAGDSLQGAKMASLAIDAKWYLFERKMVVAGVGARDKVKSCTTLRRINRVLNGPGSRGQCFARMHSAQIRTEELLFIRLWHAVTEQSNKLPRKKTQTPKIHPPYEN